MSQSLSPLSTSSWQTGDLAALQRYTAALHHLVEVAAGEGAQNGGGLHNEDEVPVYEGPVQMGMLLGQVEAQVHQGARHNGHVGERHCHVGFEACDPTPRQAGCLPYQT